MTAPCPAIFEVGIHQALSPPTGSNTFPLRHKGLAACIQGQLCQGAALGTTAVETAVL